MIRLNPDYPKHLKAARQAKGTIRQAAELLGMKHQQLHQLETSTTVPSPATIIRLVNGLGMELWMFFCELVALPPEA